MSRSDALRSINKKVISTIMIEVEVLKVRELTSANFCTRD